MASGYSALTKRKADKMAFLFNVAADFSASFLLLMVSLKTEQSDELVI